MVMSEVESFSVVIGPPRYPEEGVVRPIVSKIYLRIGAEAFPSEEWDDFTAVLLGWWIEEIMKLATGKRRNAVLLFMDGPFEVHLHPTSDNPSLLDVEYHNRHLKSAGGHSRSRLAEV